MSQFFPSGGQSIGVSASTYHAAVPSEVKVTGPCCPDRLWGGPFLALPASGSSGSSLGSRLCLLSHGLLLCGSVSSPLRGIHRWIQDPSDNPRHPVWRSVTSSHQKGPFSRRGRAHKWVGCDVSLGPPFSHIGSPKSETYLEDDRTFSVPHTPAACRRSSGTVTVNCSA